MKVRWEALEIGQPARSSRDAGQPSDLDPLNSSLSYDDRCDLSPGLDNVLAQRNLLLCSHLSMRPVSTLLQCPPIHIHTLNMQSSCNGTSPMRMRNSIDLLDLQGNFLQRIYCWTWKDDAMQWWQRWAPSMDRQHRLLDVMQAWLFSIDRSLRRCLRIFYFFSLYCKIACWC